MLSIEASEQTYNAIQEKLMRGESFVVAPQGTSMFPLFTAGRDQVRITPVISCRKPRRGDIALYRRENGLLVLHRLHHKDKSGCYFVGDNQVELEGPLSEEQILGIVTRIYRAGKQFSPHHIIYWTVSRLWLLLRPFRHVISKRAKKILIFLKLYDDTGDKSR